MKYSATIHPKARVILAGAGPGDADLVTVKLTRCLAQADVVITDRLVNPEIIEQYARAGAKILLAGKQGYNHASVSQIEINELLLQYALEGNYVVRLKGGDTSFFSNMLDELNTLDNYGIPYEIIPGVTAASGAAAYAGFPLTARGHAKGVRLLTVDKESSFATHNWNELAYTTDTLVFYMCSGKLPQLLQRLTKEEGALNKSIAVIEQATTIYQKVHCGKIFDDHRAWLPDDVQMPALVVIGSVTALHQQYKWFTTTKEMGSVFPPLEEKIDKKQTPNTYHVDRK
jgi:uroporphyrin-III C-methyltransferase